MKILAIADRPPKEKISTLVATYQIEIVCTLGDLEQLQIADLENITDIPKNGVYGNHCSGMYFEPLGIKNMHLTTFEYKGVTFGGFEGSVRYKNDPYAKMYTQKEADVLLRDFPRVDIMLAHCPPFGINDEPDELAHQGFRALRKYIEEKSPKYFLHGHTYPKQEELATKFESTEIVYVSGEKIIEVLI